MPLLISHPQSPFQGQHFSEPVELIDIFPSILDMFPVNPIDVSCGEMHPDMNRCLPLQGKSLAPVVLGTPVGDQGAPSALYNKQIEKTKPKQVAKNSKNQKKNSRKVISHPGLPVVHSVLPSLGKDLFAVSQSWRCALKAELMNKEKKKDSPNGKLNRDFMSPFFECNRDDCKNAKKRDEQISVMGYTFRYSSFRYTIWLHWDRVKNMPQLLVPPYAEELYDHRGETLENFTHLELVNLIYRPDFKEAAEKLKFKALSFLKNDVKFRGPYDK